MPTWAAMLRFVVAAGGLPMPAVALAEFQVNTTTLGHQSDPVVAVDPAGNFVVAWRGVDNGTFGVFARRYDSGGLPLGSEFLVNTYVTGHQRQPAIASAANGNFVVVWTSEGGQDGSNEGIFAQRYDIAGAALGGEFQVNAYTSGSQLFPAVAVDDAGNALIVWASGAGQDGDDSGVFGQRLDGAGLPLGGEFQVNTYTTSTQSQPGATTDAAGNFVVVWTSLGQDGDYYGVFGQRLDGAGLPLGGEFQVNSSTTDAQQDAAVAADGSGRFMVVWESAGAAGVAVNAQRYDGSGIPLGTEFQVNSYSTNSYASPAVAADGAGNFIVVWSVDWDGSGVFGQRYDSGGLPLGSEFLVNTYTPDYQTRPAVAADGTTNFVTVWQSYNGQDGSMSGIFGQRNKPDRLIRAKKLSVVDPDGSENRRSVLVLGQEIETEIGPRIDGDPTVVGATLRLIANGTTPSDQTYILDASGWTTLGTKGFRYRGPTGADDDPVRLVILQRTLFRTARMMVMVKGSIGSQSLDVVPPNLGDDGGAILEIGNGGGTYCVAAGGAAGGTEARDTPQRWRITNATGQACPTP